MSSDQLEKEDTSADLHTAKTALTSERGPAPEQGDENGTPQESVESSSQSSELSSNQENPPLPNEEPPPPLPNEPPPAKQQQDDGWEPAWDPAAQAYYFYNRFSGLTQWENPRVPDSTQQGDSTGTEEDQAQEPAKRPHGGYDPAIHGDYDPTASYAVEAREQEEAAKAAAMVVTTPAAADYAATGHFNRFTGKWQAATVQPDNFNDENKSKRQMNAFFDVDAAANSHQGKSLKAERSAKKISKQELKAFKEKRREKKEEKRRAWLRD
ncbi:hypothetical protein MMC10_001072 [Thelotrema lepadinum]|nr:hypothetical protein [Thelotrema lepadinum]